MDTVRVRIAVAVDDNGEWAAAGWAGANDSDLIFSACDGLSHPSIYWDGLSHPPVYWVTADLPIPQAIEVKGEAET